MNPELGLTIKLVRHGQSLANTGESQPHLSGDARIGLSELGKQQAQAVGAAIGQAFLARHRCIARRTRELAKRCVRF